MKETIKLIPSPWALDPKPEKVIEVEYREIPHPVPPYQFDNPKAYEAYVDGKLVGKLFRECESTDRHYGRIRVPGKGRPAWSWQGPNPGDGAHMDGVRAHHPGSYEQSRGSAVARMLGYDFARKVKK